LYLFFIDDSGDPGNPTKNRSTRHLVYGGLALPISLWNELSDEYKALQQKYGLSHTQEVKWSSVYSKDSKRNPLYNRSSSEKFQYRLDMLQIVANHPEVKVISVVMRKQAYYQKYPNVTVDQIYSFVCTPLIERFQYFLQPPEANSFGLIIADERGSKQETKYARNLGRELVHRGSYFAHVDRIVEGILFTPSDISIGVKLADFCMGALFVYFESGDPTFLRIIRANLRKSKSGKIKGFGIKELGFV